MGFNSPVYGKLEFPDDPERAARLRAQELMQRRLEKAMQAIDDALESEDEKVRLTAAEMLLSRLVPKVKAREVDEGKDGSAGVIEVVSVERKALRAEIREIMKGERDGDGN